ncbi:MAG: hypothetical protein QOJ63_1715 [Solirubrobacteraceae bacterium]|nr:hypothetical protein [Solirubrobacteraceae bacterium]
MYAEHSDGDDAALYGVLYVCDRGDVADAVKRAALPCSFSVRTTSNDSCRGYLG